MAKQSSLDDPFNTTSGNPIKGQAMASTIKTSDTINYNAVGTGGKTYKKFAKRDSPAAKMAESFGGTVPANLQRNPKTEATDPFASKNYGKSKSMSLAASDAEKLRKRKGLGR